MASIQNSPLDLMNRLNKQKEKEKEKKKVIVKKDSSNIKNKYNKRDHTCMYCRHMYRRCRCNRKMYNGCNKMLKMIMMLIILYIVCKLMCSRSNNRNAFRLVKRY